MSNNQVRIPTLAFSDSFRELPNRERPVMAQSRLTIRDFGIPDFQAIDIDPVVVAEGLQAYVNRGSRLTGVSLDDIDLGVVSIPSNLSAVTLIDLLELGMKLFDAIVWLSAGRPESHPLEIDSSKIRADLPSLMEIARSVFYCYFFLLTQARYPSPQGLTDPPKTPNFLRVVMGLDEPQHTYIETICSFNANDFDPRWVRHVSFHGLGQESLSRFGLGVAGYRLFGPFKLIVPARPVPVALQNAYNFARAVASTPPTWDIHPLTRDPAVLTKRGNLNKNLGNLILDIYNEEELNLMVSSKMLYQRPQREPTCTNYRSWAANDDISGNSYIFGPN